jgi:integrase
VEKRDRCVERTWVQSPGGQHIIGPPKTDAGRRSIAMPSHVLPAVEEHLLSIGSRPDDWLFPGEEEGYPISTRTLSHVWSKARKAIGRTDLRFHDLRHSGLTWAAATGASLAELMRRAGHVSPVAALRYQHATDDRDRALADSLAALGSTALPSLRCPSFPNL